MQGKDAGFRKDWLRLQAQRGRVWFSDQGGGGGGGKLLDLYRKKNVIDMYQALNDRK